MRENSSTILRSGNYRTTRVAKILYVGPVRTENHSPERKYKHRAELDKETGTRCVTLGQRNRTKH